MNPRPAEVEDPVAPLVEGVWSRSESIETTQVINPANGKPLFCIPVGCDADVDHAVASARRAFDDGRWSDAPPSFRKKTLHRLADLIEAEGSRLDALDAGEMGKPVSITFCSAASSAGLMRFCAEAVDKVLGDVMPSDKSSLVIQQRVPRGVVAAVVPWNFPTYMAVLKLAPALAAGNCVVIKPSEMASRSTLRLAELALRAAIPPGVLNVVPGLGHTVGRALGLHPKVDMMTFTGSTSVGKKMFEYAGQSNMKAILAECGGKSPQIVFDDGVDLAGASEQIASFLLTNQGQICSVGSRLLVQESIASELVERIAARMADIVVGDPLAPETTFGPIASRKQCERVMSHIQDAQADGAQLVVGGKRARLDSGGYFVEPTVFRNVSPTSRIAQEEVFGPVLATISFRDVDEAVRIANSTAYGLAAYVWTGNLSTGMKMAKGVRSTVLINAAAASGEGPGHAVSFEPVGLSGVGVEGGLAGMESYLRRHSIWFNHG